MKWLFYISLLVLVIGSWMFYANAGRELETITAEITREADRGDPDDLVNALTLNYQRVDQQHTFTGILLMFLTAGLLGIVFVVHVLPALAHRFTHAVYDSAEMVEKDPMHDARSLVAQGEWAAAIDAFKIAAAADPLNRLPWVEIAKIQRDHLEDPAAAVATIRSALESQEWQVNDAAYFLFRLSELYDEGMEDRTSAVSVLQQVIDEFPESRHSANARHKLHEWGLA